jgi:hypothetical protein
MDVVKAAVGSAMERALSAHASGNKRVVAWLPEMDRILIVGMKHGPQGIREATNKVLALRAGLTRADCWKRLRSLRAAGNQSHPSPRNWPPQIKELLREGYQQGGEKKRQAIKTVRKLYPGVPSNAPSRFARGQGWIPKSTQARGRRPWTEHEERKLWELAGYETAARIAERLGRSEGAVRFRLKSLGLSVKVKDGWSFRALQELLHVGPSKLRRFIAGGSLRVRDPRISAKSLNAILEDRIAVGSTPTEAAGGAPHKLRKNATGYSWGSAARLLGVDIGQVREWIVEGKLKIVDGFVTERAFQDFCKKRGSELNCALLGNEFAIGSSMDTHCLSAMTQSHHRYPGTRSMRSLRGAVRGAEGQCEGTSSSGISKPVQEGRRNAHLLRSLHCEVTILKLSVPRSNVP